MSSLFFIKKLFFFFKNFFLKIKRSLRLFNLEFIKIYYQFILNDNFKIFIIFDLQNKKNIIYKTIYIN